MNVSLLFLRLFFLILSVLFMTTFMISTSSTPLTEAITIGVGIGLLFALLLVAFDMLFKRFNLRAFNIAIIGIFIGYLMSQALLLIFQLLLDITQVRAALQPETIKLIKTALFLFGLYLGSIMTLRSASELYMSIPFVRFAANTQKKKDLILDDSILSDSRILDIAATGLLDQQLVLPRFLVKEFSFQSEIGEEGIKTKAKRRLEIIKRLEEIPDLELRYVDTDFPEIKELFNKLLRLAHLLDANLLTADISRMQTGNFKSLKVINLHTLSNALKPLMQAGEPIRVKITRSGKEFNQGVGYLDDGTMVVINGGGSYLGKTLETQILSTKHTSAGRMIFCNAPDWQQP